MLAAACTGEMGGADDGDDGPGAGAGGSAGSGGRGGTSGSGGMTPLPMGGSGGTTAAPVCKADADPGVSPLMRLTAVQYRNTVRDLLEASGAGAAAPEIAGALAAIPPDVDPMFPGLDSGISADHIANFFRVAQLTADAITSKPDRLMAVVGACAAQTPLSSACVDGFLAGFGRRAFRRPLTAEEATSFKALNDGKGTSAEIVRSLIMGLMTAPRFLNHLEVEGTPLRGREDLLQLSPYEIASRLSYTLWQTMPDDALLEAAAKGELATDAGFTRQLDRLVADKRAKDTVWQFWNQWMRLEGYFPGFDLTRPAFKALVAGEEIGAAGKDHHGDMVKEIRELTEWMAFTKKGSLADLLTTDVSVTKSPLLARIYKTTVWSGTGEPPKMPAGTRAGLLTRSAMLVIGEEQTNPFHRGAIIRKRMLCDPLDSPDPTMLPPSSLDAPPQNPMMTTRERYEAKMTPQCRGCHNMFNDLGYILEAYDSLGRHRTMEKVFDAKTGNLLATLPIDVSGVPRVKSDDDGKVNGALELTKKVVESKKFEPCFSSSYFTYALRRGAAGGGSADQCAIDDIVSELVKPGVALGDVYKRIAVHASFRQRKVGAQ